MLLPFLPVPEVNTWTSDEWSEAGSVGGEETSLLKSQAC
jgi:hypothetical protein